MYRIYSKIVSSYSHRAISWGFLIDAWLILKASASQRVLQEVISLRAMILIIKRGSWPTLNSHNIVVLPLVASSWIVTAGGGNAFCQLPCRKYCLDQSCFYTGVSACNSRKIPRDLTTKLSGFPLDMSVFSSFYAIYAPISVLFSSNFWPKSLSVARIFHRKDRS